jgi:CheY-like chemotaxis protein
VQARRKVLYIEDNPVNVLLVQAMLARLPDVDVLVAPLPQQGLAMARDERPDLILLDIHLPGMDGFEVLRRLRAQADGRATPVIAVSANAMASDVEQGLRAGFAQYLTKPVDMPQLLHAVQRAFGRG